MLCRVRLLECAGAAVVHRPKFNSLSLEVVDGFVKTIEERAEAADIGQRGAAPIGRADLRILCRIARAAIAQLTPIVAEQELAEDRRLRESTEPTPDSAAPSTVGTNAIHGGP